MKSIHLFMISFLVYLVLNLGENFIHYNIGKYHDRTTQLDLPSQEDWIKIVVVMLLFAGLQGILTCWLDKRCS